MKYTFGSILLKEMGTSLENKNKREISARDVCRSILRTKLLTPVACNSISHPCAPPAAQQCVSRSPGRSLAALAVVVTRESPHTSAALARGAHGVSRGNVNTSTGSPCISSLFPGGQGSACSLPPPASRASLVPTCSLGRLVWSRQGGDKRLLF